MFWLKINLFSQCIIWFFHNYFIFIYFCSCFTNDSFILMWCFQMIHLYSNKFQNDSLIYTRLFQMIHLFSQFFVWFISWLIYFNLFLFYKWFINVFKRFTYIQTDFKTIHLFTLAFFRWFTWHVTDSLISPSSSLHD